MQFRRMRGPSRPTLGLCLTLLLAGCAAVGPDYVPPKLSDAGVPGQWTSGSDMAGSDKAVANTSPAFQWWAELDDPLLNQMVTEGFRTSPTLDIAVARVSQARAAYAGTRAAELPAITGDAESERSASDSSGKPSTDSWLSTNASWEIDLFGAVRRGNEGAAARAAAQQATLADVRVSLAADITDAYLSFRACQSNVALSEQDVVSREATEKLTAASVTEGFTAPYQAIRSKASVAEAKTQLASTRAYCARQENLLTRLTGIPRPELMKQLAGKPTGLDRLPVPRHFGVAIPAQSLTQRPDIRAAERKVAAASADIGLAEADRYPRLTLNGSLGYEVEGTGGGALSFGTWSFGPSLSLPIFDGGRRKANVDIAKARYDEALAEFKAKARNAIQEVEDALTRYAAAHEHEENASVSAKQYKQFFKTVEIRYREGASNLLELEDARRSMLDAQQTLLNVMQERLQAWVALNRATGGAAQYEPESTGKDQSEQAQASVADVPPRATPSE